MLKKIKHDVQSAHVVPQIEAKNERTDMAPAFYRWLSIPQATTQVHHQKLHI